MAQKGITDFFSASEVPLSDILPVIFSCAGGAKAMGVYTKDEFSRACTVLNITSEKDFKNKKAEIKNRYLNDKTLFNDVYKYSFGYMAQGGKYVDRRLCAMMLGVLVGEKYPLAQKIVDFLNSDDVRFFFLFF